MDDENLIKGKCPNCKGRFNFPAHGLGQQVPCPHCGNPVTLQATRNPLAYFGKPAAHQPDGPVEPEETENATDEPRGKTVANPVRILVYVVLLIGVCWAIPDSASKFLVDAFTSLLEVIIANLLLISVLTLPALAILFIIGLALAPREPKKSPAVSAAQFVVKAVIAIVIIFILCFLLFSALARYLGQK